MIFMWRNMKFSPAACIYIKKSRIFCLKFVQSLFKKNIYWLAIDYEWFTLLQSKLNIQVGKNIFFFYQIFKIKQNNDLKSMMKTSCSILPSCMMTRSGLCEWHNWKFLTEACNIGTLCSHSAQYETTGSYLSSLRVPLTKTTLPDLEPPWQRL